MKAVILAAGKSTRTEPLTLTRPKPLLKICNKEIIFHTLDNLVGLVDEVFIIVGYKKEMVIEKIGNDYKDIKITFMEQKEQLGTGHAVSLVRDIGDEFLLLGGDDFYNKSDLKKMCDETFAILGQKSDTPENFGVLVTNENGFLSKIIEKPKEFVSDLVNTGCYKLSPEIFEYFDIEKSDRGELEFVDVITNISKVKKVSVVETSDWMTITYPWDIIKVNEILMKNIISKKIEGVVEEGVTLIGEVIVGKGSVLKSGTYIEGPVIIGENCKVGPNCYIRPSTSIGDACHIGQGAEIKNSVISDKSNVPHLNYVGDSVIGNGCNLGAGTIIANLRHDNSNIISVIKGALIDTGRRKLGTIIGDGVHTGINTSILPGRKLWPNTSTRPGQVIERDVME